MLIFFFSLKFAESIANSVKTNSHPTYDIDPNQRHCQWCYASRNRASFSRDCCGRRADGFTTNLYAYSRTSSICANENVFWKRKNYKSRIVPFYRTLVNNVRSIRTTFIHYCRAGVFHTCKYLKSCTRKKEGRKKRKRLNNCYKIITNELERVSNIRFIQF